jgi:2-methylcitrate dehydratase PrpD
MPWRRRWPAQPVQRRIANERDGSVASETREAPRGSEQSFASAEEIIAKFRKLTRAAITKPQRDALVDAAFNLEKLRDCRTNERVLLARPDKGLR